YGQSYRCCDGVSRRSFLKIGSLGLSALALPDLLRAEAATNSRQRQKSVIMVYLPGGPPHQDTFDLKLDAPAEIRGEFKPIRTNVRGLKIGDLAPGLAEMMDNFAVILSISDAVDDHSDFMCMPGRRKNVQPAGGWPTFGATVSKLLGPVDSSIPPFIGLEPKMQHHPYNASNAGYAGVGHSSF